MRRPLLIIAVGLLLSACGGGRTTWLKPGATYTDWQRDAHECDPSLWPPPAGAAGGSSTKPDPAASAAPAGQPAADAGYELPKNLSPTARFNACMKARGWEQRKTPKGTVPPSEWMTP